MAVKNAVLILPACLCLALGLASCSKSAEKPSDAAAGTGSGRDATSAAGSQKVENKVEKNPDGTFTMRIGHAQSEESPRHRSLALFKEQVEKRTGGKVKVEIFPDGKLGDETEMTVAVSEGRLEAVRGGDLEFVPKITMLGLPMVADTLADARKLCYSGFVADMLSVVEQSNMKVLAVGDDSGFRQITNSERPVHRPSDMKGMKIRAPQIVATVNFLTELGASATVVPFTELYAALAEGRVSGQENPLALIDSSRFYEVQKYCTIIDYQFFPELMYVCLDWWKSLPGEFQKVLEECARAMMDENARITDAENEAYIRHIQAEGCQVVTLTAAERSAFLPYAERVWEKYVDMGYATRQEIKDMLSIVGKSVTW